MTKRPESYPFLRIAREFNVPYCDVLLIAWFWDDRNIDGGSATPQQSAAIIRNRDADDWPELRDAIQSAHHVQRLIRNGVIDWQTGKPVRLDSSAEQQPRRDANGDVIPWPKDADYFMGFDPDNPDIPTD